MKKIWLISYQLDGVTAGPAVRFQRYAPFFKEKGYRLVIYTFKANKQLPDKESREDFDIVRVRSDYRFFHNTLFLAKCLWKAIMSKEKPHSILTFGLTTFHLWLLPVLKLKKLKLIFVNTMSLHTTYLKGNSMFTKLYNTIHYKLYGVLYRNLDYIVNSSSALTDGFRKLKVSESKLVNIYNGVNNKRFKPLGNPEKLQYRKKLDLPENGMIFLFVGLKVERKGILDLIESWKLFIKQNKDAYLVLVGDEKESASDQGYNKKWNDLKNEFENSELRILNRPNHPQIEEYFYSSDVFVFLSKKEGMPNVVLEAMASGLPMITTEFEGFSDDYGISGKHYILVDRNHTKIADEFRKLSSDRIFYESIKKNALERTESHFLVEASIDKYVQLFEK
ncbi:MAG: glycosyltransferase family 4 protein [Flavobacteriales bacterium]|nr:glycosyltransferase family 4 protein [Flavobacteriales bacterium]